ncbi:MAG: hypothetical protein L3J43_08540 [Sulfurovum sp.]|nr:hypothetical protein [Sulfurovum sp.]
MTEQDIKILERAVRSAHELHINLEALDFELAKFNKFEQKISSFKIKSMLVMATTGLIIGALIGFISAQKWAIQ